MIYPSGDKIEKQVDSKYSLVIAVSQRAKQLKEGARKLVETRSTNPITIALEEIAAGKILVTTPSVAETAARLKRETDERKGPKKPADILMVESTDDLSLGAGLSAEDVDMLAEIAPVDPSDALEEYPLIPAVTDDETDIDGLPVEEEEELEEDEAIELTENEEESEES